MEPIEGAYPLRYGNLFFHKELCYRTIENVNQYLIDNTERVLDVLANGAKQIPEKRSRIVTEEDVVAVENKIKKDKPVKTKKVRRKR
jgi:hypothetical protein